MQMGGPGTDAHLLEAIAQGDRDAYAELYRRYSLTSLAIARASAGSDAEDVNHDVWLAIWDRSPVEAIDFLPWLTVTIRRAASKRSSRRSKVGTLEGYLDAGGTSPTRHLERQNAVAILREAKRRGEITEREYEAIVDSITSEDTSREIATAQALSRTGWRDRVSRGLRKLRRLTCS